MVNRATIEHNKKDPNIFLINLNELDYDIRNKQETITRNGERFTGSRGLLLDLMRKE